MGGRGGLNIEGVLTSEMGLISKINCKSVRLIKK